MDCLKILKLMDRFVKKDLSIENQAIMNEHLRECQRCQQKVHELQTLYHILSFPEEIALPHGFTDQVMKQIRGIKMKEKATEPLYKVWGASLIAAAVVMLMLNATKLPENLDYKELLEKTTMVQRSINFSLNETTNIINQLFQKL